MTYRERREARAGRLRGWADKREAKADAVFASQAPYRDDIAFNTQPGRIPLRERINRQAEGAFESIKKAERMDERAGNIESQLAVSIYDDDPDAESALLARISRLEQERDSKKTANAKIRKALKGLPDDQWPAKLAEIGESNALSPMWRPGCGIWAATYGLTNLSSDINRNRKRLEALLRAAS